MSDRVHDDRDESQSARGLHWETQRVWKVINPNKVNRHGQQHRLQAGTRGGDPLAAGLLIAGIPARSSRCPHRLGDCVRRRRALAGG
jgi:Cu2+-containing amine oxidase